MFHPTGTAFFADDEAHVSAAVPVEIAITLDEQRRGLSGARGLAMPDREGLAFVFAPPTIAAFTLAETAIALAIAFVDERGVVVSVQEGAAWSSVPLVAPCPIVFAVELHAAWARSLGVQPGWRARLTRNDDYPKRP